MCQYRLDRIAGDSTYFAAANNEDAKRKAFKLLGVKRGMTLKLFEEYGGRRVVKLGTVEQQVYPPKHH